ncbi:arylsulfatase [Jatrophihabitans sp. GAS493]|uniref:arylsulfatase n=1 Tax=Jatrophihabitans sp. GAS493 TaxID=1907575 RepID=UPI000BB716D4|nr:arylsulfatase [Jatrophihabitans sp. GAS493]SOD74693.1 arylsulfatase [Jatrophihabitans sp. GAS493]
MSDVQRQVLPIADAKHIGLTTYVTTDPDTSYPPIAPLRPPTGAPNVLVVLLDDVGFGAASAFGGPCETPTADRLAAEGLKYNRFHTTALCSPTRAALLSGRNHHSVGMGAITEMATSAPGYNSLRPNTCAPLAEMLRLNGYSTAQFGKCHEVPVFESSPIGPFDHWPHPGGGFEYFYGFIGGENNQWYPALYEQTTPVEPWGGPEDGYHLMDDLADKTIGWMRQQKSMAPDRPFFAYLAPGATHAPHHVPQDWIEKYKGKFDQGWDAVREATFARQKELGVIPADAELTARPEEIPAWEEMDEALRPVLARQMEVYAAFLSYADHHVGRVVDALADMGLLEDTLIYYIIGDNGASGEGTVLGTTNELMVSEAPDLATPEWLIEHIDDLGTPRAYNHYAVGWAHAMDTPFQWTKQIASHWGGTRNGTIVHWPSRIAAKGEVRSQFHHVVDFAPTIMEAANLPFPTSVNGIAQEPFHGVSMAYSFDDPSAPERRETQYFEMMCNRGIYHKGWTAVTKHAVPWVFSGRSEDVEADVWELYNTNVDWTQANDLADEMPEKLAELQRLFLIEATKYNVLPLEPRFAERFNPDLAGRPNPVAGSTQLLFGGMHRLQENVVINVKNKTHSVTAEVEIRDSGARGVIIAQGGSTGGWSLYVHEGKLRYGYNFVGAKQYYVGTDDPLPTGTHQVRMEFAYDGGGIGKGGTVSLFLDGAKVGEGRVERTHWGIFSMDETTEVGSDAGTPVVPDYGPTGNDFNGRVAWVQIDIDAAAADQDHLINPEERYRIAVAKQ